MATVEERLLFENEDWAVAESGLEHKRTGYFIEREAVGQRRSDGLWLWPLHVAEKSWCRMPPFMEAFACAASAYGVRPDVDLARSFMTARQDIAEWPLSFEGEEDSVVRSPDRLEGRSSLRRASVPRAHGPRHAARPAISPWRAPRRIRRAGTTLVRMLQAAWNKK